MGFWTLHGREVPAVTEGQMREVDRIAVEDFGLGILQMMENAGRNLALATIDMLRSPDGVVTVVAGGGGNGGGGICCARHLHNRGVNVRLVLDREAALMDGPAGHQLNILQKAGVQPAAADEAREAIRTAQVVVDAIIGYSLRGAPREVAMELIELCNDYGALVLSLDVPSGVNSTTGATPGAAVQPQRTLTLALPKTGLDAIPGDLYLADIGIPPSVYAPLGLDFKPFFGGDYVIELQRGETWRKPGGRRLKRF